MYLDCQRGFEVLSQIGQSATSVRLSAPFCGRRTRFTSEPSLLGFITELADLDLEMRLWINEGNSSSEHSQRSFFLDACEEVEQSKAFTGTLQHNVYTPLIE